MSAPKFTRRHLVALGAASAAAAGLGAGGRVWSWWDRAPGEGFKKLSADEAEIVDCIAEAIFPPGGTPALSGRDAGASRYLDDVLAEVESPTGDLLRLLLHALDDWARLTRLSGWAKLSIEERGEALQAWSRHESHLIRGAITGLTIFISTAYTTHPEVQKAAGWVFPCGYTR